MSNNPWVTPSASSGADEFQDGDERARAATWTTERRIRGWGAAWMLSGGAYVLMGMMVTLGAVVAPEAAKASDLTTGALMLCWGGAFGGIGWTLYALRPSARSFGVLGAVGGCLFGPCGVFNLIPLIAVTSGDAAVVLTAEHAALRERTRWSEDRIRAKVGSSNLWLWVVVALVLFSIGTIAALTVLGERLERQTEVFEGAR